MSIYVLSSQGGLFGNGVGGGSESPLGGLGAGMGSASSAAIMGVSATKHMLQAQPSLRDPSKGTIHFPFYSHCKFVHNLLYIEMTSGRIGYPLGKVS